MRNIGFAVVAVLLGTSALVAPLQGQSGLAVWVECLGGELSVESVTACLEAGADPTARERDGSTLLHAAAGREGGPAVVEVLLAAGADVMARTEDGGTPLHAAAGYGGSLAVVEILLAAGADPNAQGGGGFGGTPLHVAVSHGDAAGVEALVAAGADVMARDGLGWTPLHHAASLAEVAILLAAGADVMARSRYDGRTPLHGAVTETVEALLAAGADVMAREANGMTPLHRAADLCCRDCSGSCPAVSIATIVDPYSASGEHLRPNLDSDTAVLRALLAAGADPNARDGLGWTPLHFVASNSSAATRRAAAEGVETLLAAGAAIRRVAAEGVEALLAAGADPNARNRDRETPFDLAEQGSDVYWLLNDARYNAPTR